MNLRGTTRGAAARFLVLGGLGLLAAAMVTPFLTGSKRLLLVPLARALPLPALASLLARDGQWASAGAVTLLGLVVPAALALSLLPALAWPGVTRPRAVAALSRCWRWGAWGAALLGAALAFAIRASSGRDGVSVHLGPGAWLFLAGLALLAAAATLLAGDLRRRGAGRGTNHSRPPGRNGES